MHRGSSKGAQADGRAPETLPLSASPPAQLQIEIEVARGGRSTLQRMQVAEGSTIRSVLRAAGLRAEGCAVLIGERPMPLDAPIEADLRLTVIPTFSGG